MKIDKVVKELLEIHCIGCNGKVFGCRGCDIERNIHDVIKSNLKEEESKKVVALDNKKAEEKEEPIKKGTKKKVKKA